MRLRGSNSAPSFPPLRDAAPFVGRPVVLAEKLDGLPVRLTQAAALAGEDADLQLLRQLHATRRRAIEPGWTLFGEWTQDVRSVEYDALPNYLHLFAARDDAERRWWSWEELRLIADRLGCPTLPVDWEGVAADERELMDRIQRLASAPSRYGPARAGVLVLAADSLESFTAAAVLATPPAPPPPGRRQRLIGPLNA